MSLRKEIIRLAHSNPELREHLLPLIKESSWDLNERFVAKRNTKVLLYYNNYFSESNYRKGHEWWGITKRLGTDFLVVSLRDFNGDLAIMHTKDWEIIGWSTER